MYKIQGEARCVACGAKLTGVALDGVCPRCEWRVSDSIDTLCLDTETGRLVVDFYCGECGYNLRSLQCDACCTECGTPIAPSLRPIELRSADRRWVAKLHRRARLAFWSLLCVPASVIGGFVAPLSTGLAAILFAALLLGTFLMGMIAISGLATPEPGVGRVNRPIWPEYLASWLPYLLTACVALFLFGDAFPPFDAAGIIVAVVFVLLTLASVFACIVCARKIARRTGDVRLEELAGGIAVALGSAIVLVATALVTEGLFAVARSSMGGMFMGISAIIAGGLTLLAYLLTLMTLFGLRRELGRVLRQGGWRTPGD